MSKNLYIVEGAIEERFIRTIQHINLIQVGRIAKFNLMQNTLQNSSNILTKRMDKIYCIIDTDCAEASNIGKLNFNMEKLRSICPKNRFCLVQNKNFEDELKYMLDCNNLAKFFRLKHDTLKDIKTYLAQSVNYEGYVNKEKLLRYCSRAEEFVSMLNCKRIKIVGFEKCLI